MATSPWLQYQQTAPPTGGPMPWEKYAGAQPSSKVLPPAPTAMSRLRDVTHSAQGYIDDLTRIKPFDPAHPIDTTVGNVGAGLLQPLSLLAHPKASAEAMQPHGIGENILSLVGGPAAIPALRMGEQFAHDPAGTAEQGIGMLAGAGLGDLVPDAGAPLKSVGANIMNRTVGALAPDFKRGANPGAAYLEGGGTPSMTMGGLARKGAAVQKGTGNTLGILYDAASQPAPWYEPTAAPKISVTDAASALLKPISDLRIMQEGPGGIGASPALDAYEERLAPTLLDADKAGGFTPRALFNLKRSVADNTRWNDPAMFDLNAARQEGVGGLGDLLTDVVPEAKPQNKIYQGALKFANRAEQRAATGQTPLSQIGRRAIESGVGAAAGMATHNPLLALLPFIADSIPAKSAAAYGIFQGGRGLSAIPRLGPLVGAASATGAIKPKAKTKKDEE